MRIPLWRIQIVDFDQSDSGRIILPAQDRCVVTWSKSAKKSAFFCVRRLPVGWDLICLTIGLPIIIAREQVATAIMQLQSRISQCSGNIEWWRGQGRAEPPGEKARSSFDDEAADHHIVARPNQAA